MKKIRNLLLSFSLLLTMVPLNINAGEDRQEALDNEKSRQEQYFNLIDELIEAETKFGLSGAQLTVLHNEEKVHSKGYGYKNNFENIVKDGEVDLKGYKVIPNEERVPVTTETLFDLASNTKMYGLNYAIQKLVQDGELTLDTKVQDIFPEFKYRGYGENFQDVITIEDLLMHKAGFTPDPQYHNENSKINNAYFPDTPEGVNPLYSHDREKTKEMVLKTPLIYERGTRHAYSDADFMLLGFIVEEITGKKLDVYMEETFYEPLGLNNLTFNPLDNGFPLDHIVASEVHGNTRDGFIDFKNVRETVVNGEVHDEKAFYSMDGVSGHAGLFGNSEDVAELASQMIREDSIFTPETIQKFSKSSELNDTYGVGWRKQGEGKRYGWAFSPYASAETIGHTGWTGTLTVIDPVNNVVISLNTNSRNTPIMGDDPNTFFTANFNTNGYGMVSTLVYEALGLGSEKTADESLIELFEAELPKNYDNVTISKRNVVRSLVSAIEKASDRSTVLEEYMDTEIFQDTLLNLENANADDFKILSNPESYRIGHKRLSNLYEKVKDIDNEYSDEAWSQFSTALMEAAEVLENHTAKQQTVNQAYERLQASVELLTIEETKQAAMLVERMIYRLPNVRILTIDDAAALESVRTAYDQLSKESKGYVKSLRNLELREERLEALMDEEVADRFAVLELQRKIYRLPNARNLTLEDAKQVVAVRKEYEALNNASKAIFSSQYLKNLEVRETMLANAL